MPRQPEPRIPEEGALQQQELGENYGQKALIRIRKAVEGNGLDPQTVLLGAVEGSTYNFEAHIYFRFTPKTTEENLQAGRPPGATCQTLPTRADLEREIAVYTHKIIEDPTSGAQAAAVILARPDCGFGFTQETLPAAFAPKNYLLKENCPDCKGATKSACAKCHGSSKTACPKCKTTKFAICPLCYGRKTSADKKNKCIKCLGHGRIPCMACHQTGYIPCTGCGGTGKNTCKTCSGTGWTGRRITVEMGIVADYDYNRGALPPELAPIVEKLGPKAVAQGYARLESGPVIRGEDRASFIIPCQLTMPFAKVGVMLPDQNFTCTIFGYNGRVTGLPPFLDRLIEPGVRELRKAAASGNIALPHIRKACQFRAIKLALLAAAKTSPGQAIESLRREHGTTLSIAMTKNLVALANRALNRIATLPTLIGMGIGLSAATGIYALAFSQTGRDLISGAISNAALSGLVDLLILLTGGFLTTLGASTGARQTFRSVLGDVAQGKSTIRRRWATILGWALSIVFFFGIALAAKGEHAPQWLSALTHIAG